MSNQQLEFSWSDTYRDPGKKVDAQIAGEAIAKLARNNDLEIDSVTPEMVLKYAAPAASPLHDIFDWNDSTAAHQFRLIQARNMLRSLRIVVRKLDDPIEKRRFLINVPMASSLEEAPKNKAYVPVADAMKSPELRPVVLRNALQELRAFQRRYAELQELADVIAHIDVVLERHGAAELPMKKSA